MITPVSAGQIPPVPELFLLPEQERGDAWKDFWSHYRGRWLFGLIIFAPPLAFVLDYLLLWRVTWLPGWSHILIVAAMLLGAVLLAVRCIKRPFQRYLRAELNRRGIAICTRCGYDLRGQTDARCPECGLPFNGPAPGPGSSGAD